MDRNKCTLTDKHKPIEVACLKINNKRFPVYKGVNTIGRNKAAIVNLKNLNVSQNHAFIMVVDDHQHYISDLDSSNGTYLLGSPLVPFKLYELTDQVEVKFGNLVAIYLKLSDINGTFNTSEGNLEMTQNVTQNFYGANTQIISDHSINMSRLNTLSQENKKIDDIHEAKTQRVNLPNHFNNNSLDIHDAPTQVVDYCLKINDEIAKMHVRSPTISNSDVLEDTIEDIHAADTQVVIFPKPSTSRTEDNLHEAATQVVSYFSNTMQEQIEDKTDNIDENHLNHTAVELETKNVVTSSSNDETEPYSLLLNSLEIKTAMPNTIIEETIVDETLNEHKNKANLDENSNESVDFLEMKSNENEDENSILTGSQDIDSRKLRKSRKLSSSEDSTATIQPENKCSSDSDTDVDEDVIEKFNQTQKNNIKNDPPETFSETNEIIKPKILSKLEFFYSDSETDVEDNKENIEIDTSTEIAQEKNSSKTEILDDTDLIPPTQDAFANLFNYKNTNKQGNTNINSHNGSSEESFKLGLTEMMGDTEDDKILCEENETNKNLSEDILISKQKIDVASDCTGEDNIVSQKTDDNLVKNLEQNIDTDIYLVATQKLPTEEQLGKTAKILEENEDVYLTPTQQIQNIKVMPKKNVNKFEKIPSISKMIEVLEDDKLYLMPTQKLDEHKEFKEPPNKFTFKKMQTNLNGSFTKIFGEPRDIYDADTQKLDNNEFDEIYLQPTQKLNEKQVGGETPLKDEDVDVYLQATQKLNYNKATENTNLNETESDIYFQPTQDLFSKTNKIETQFSMEQLPNKNDFKKPESFSTEHLHENGETEKTESLLTNEVDSRYLEPTQKLDIFETQNNIDNKISEISKGKALANLSKDDNTILPTQKNSEHLKHTDQSKLTVDDMKYDLPTQPLSSSSQEFETQKEICFSNQVINVDMSTNRPSNPLAQVLSDVKEDSTSTAKILKYTSEDKKSAHSNIEQSKKIVAYNDVESETLSQIQAFVNQPLENILTNKLPGTKLSSNEQTSDNSINEKKNISESKLGSSSNIDKKDIQVKSSFLSKDINDSKMEQETFVVKSKRLPKKIDMLNIQESKESVDGVESLSKNWASSKKPSNISTKSKKLLTIEESPVTRRINRKVNDEKINENKTDQQEPHPSLNNTEFQNNEYTVDLPDMKHTRTTKGEDCKPVLKPEPTNYIKEQNLIAETSVDTKNINTEAGTSYIHQTSVKSDIDQSFALLEAKSSKSRKSQRISGVNEINVISKNRRSMEVSSVSKSKQVALHPATRTSRRIKENNTVVEKAKTNPGNLKRTMNERTVKKNTQWDSDFESEIPTKIQKINEKKKVEEKRHDGENTNLVTKVEKEPTTSAKGRTNSRRMVSGANKGKDDSATSGSFTPSRKRKMESNESNFTLSEKSKRTIKPKVVFTMLDNPQLESYIRQLGGSIVDTVDACTVLVTGQIKRSQKLLSAVGQGKPICSPQWILESKKADKFLDPWDYILSDPEAESKWDFTLKESLNRATNTKLFTNYTFMIMVSNANDVLKGAIESSGGKCVTRNSQKNIEGFFVVVASPENRNKYLKIKKQTPEVTVIEPEAIFDGVLRQELRLGRHILT